MPDSTSKSPSSWANIRRRYGISQEQYELLARRQGGACAICQRVTKLVIDHNHKTGDVRGLLCAWCNRHLSAFWERSELFRKAAAYLEAEPYTRGTAVLGPVTKRRRRKKRV